MASRARMAAVAGIGSKHPVPCIGRPAKPGVSAPINTCPVPATHVLACTAWAVSDQHPQGGPVDLVVGMCEGHRALITAWAWRRWGHLDEGVTVPVEDLPVLMEYLLGEGDDGRELVAPAIGEGWQSVG